MNQPYRPRPSLYDGFRDRWSVPTLLPVGGELSIRGIDRASFLAALFNSGATLSGRPSAVAVMHRRQAHQLISDIEAEEANIREAKNILPSSLHCKLEMEIEGLWSIGVLDGRPIHVSLRRDTVDPSVRDSYYGDGSTAFILALLKTGLKPHHEVFHTLRLETLS